MTYNTVRELLTPEQFALYNTNPWFRDAVNHLLDRVVPMFIVGAQVQAVEQQAAMDKMKRDLTMMPSPKILLDDLFADDPRE